MDLKQERGMIRLAFQKLPWLHCANGPERVGASIQRPFMWRLYYLNVGAGGSHNSEHVEE